MNKKSTVADESRTTLKLHKLQVFRWFHDNQGKEYSAIEKPLDTPKLISERLAWVRKYFDLLTDENAPVAYIDEKFFCTTNQHRKIKKLPIGHHESSGAYFTPAPKIRSRCFPI